MCFCVATAQNSYNIVPLPVSIVEKPGHFNINRQTEIIVLDENVELQGVVKFLVAQFKAAAGFSPAILTGQSAFPERRNVIYFVLRNNLEEEEYKLQITPGKVVVESATPKGAFYAVQTLFQLLPPDIYSPVKIRQGNWTMPCAEITDKPRFAWRGMHLDVCSHFFPVDYIKRYLDLMAIHKQNVFHWHLTEDQGWRIEIKRYPELTQKGSIRKETVIGEYSSGIYDGIPYGGFYTQDEVREIVRYASERFITVIPEIEMPGHSLAAIACFPQLSCAPEDKYEVGTRWGVYRQVYCPKPETFEFLENVLEEIMELFPSKYIHIGGDECPKTSWKKCAHCQNLIAVLGLKDEFELQSFFVQRMEKFVNSRGRQIIGWDEILQGGLAPNATVMSWLGEEGGIKSAQQHHNAVMSPHTKYYLDYYQADPETEKICMGHLVPLKEVYLYNPVPDTLTQEERPFIIGVQGCVWTEYMADPARVEYMAFPRALAISEAAWTNPERKDWNNFTRRIEAHFKRLDRLKVNYCKTFYDVAIRLNNSNSYTKVVTLETDTPDAVIHYTTDGTKPSTNSPVYTTPFVINRSETVRAAAFRNNKQTGKETQKRITN
jgi:hexosaminidase